MKAALRIEGSRAISIFRGRKIEGDTVIVDNGVKFHLSECRYHASYDWLMPVLFLIPHEFELRSSRFEIYAENGTYMVNSGDVEDVFMVLAEYLKENNRPLSQTKN